MLPIAPCLAALLAAAAGPESSPDASELLEEAARAQHAGALAASVRDFHASAFVQVRSQGSRVDFDVDYKFRLPDRLWYRIEERSVSGSRIQRGYDGEVAWQLDERRGDCVRLEGPVYRSDRRKTVEEVARMRQLLRFFFLENLRRETEGWKRLDDESRDGITAYVVRGRGELPGDDPRPATLTLWIEHGTYRLLGARVETSDAPPVQFCFWHHRPSPQGVVVPGSIKIYRGDEERPSQVLALKVEEDRDGRLVNAIRFNAGFPDDLFEPPCD